MVVVRILGPSGKQRDAVERATRTALDDLGLRPDIEIVEDRATTARYGVMATPAVMVDGDVVVSGRVPTSAELQALLSAIPAP
jgi:predicted thioredoxin/glutaredoxin